MACSLCNKEDLFGGADVVHPLTHLARDEIVGVAVDEDDRYPAAQDHSETTFDDIEASKTNGRFQGSGRINLDLSEYAGKTVDVVFAAVPKLNTQSLVLLFCFEDVVIL